MIGIFDSGAGGEAALAELRRLAPRADICFFADIKNAPYGTKSEYELKDLIKRDIKILKDAGSDKILMACCTASTLYDRLSESEKKLCIPIISPTVDSALKSAKRGRIGVVATRHTVNSHAFSEEIGKRLPSCCVKEYEAQFLVNIAEERKRKKEPTSKDLLRIKELTKKIRNEDLDVLILGCTHFSLLEDIIEKELSELSLINSAKEGARKIYDTVDTDGHGKTIYL